MYYPGEEEGHIDPSRHRARPDPRMAWTQRAGRRTMPAAVTSMRSPHHAGPRRRISTRRRRHSRRRRESMDVSRSRVGTMLALGIGVAMGWVGSGWRAAPMWAGAGDRAGECIVATGPVLMEYDNATKSQIPLEALYFLDYKGGRLLGTVPTYRLGDGRTQILDGFAERDLCADFKLDLAGGPRPRFLMTTGSLGRFSSGWAPLYVFETTTSQVGRLPDAGRPDVRSERADAVRAGGPAQLSQARGPHGRTVSEDHRHRRERSVSARADRPRRPHLPGQHLPRPWFPPRRAPSRCRRAGRNSGDRSAIYPWDRRG